MGNSLSMKPLNKHLAEYERLNLTVLLAGHVCVQLHLMQQCNVHNMQ